MAVDYRGLNQTLLFNAVEMPSCANLISDLGAFSGRLSALDLASGFFQLPVAAESQHLLAFNTPDGRLMQFTVLPFGVSVGPALFQQTLQMALRGLSDCCLAYVDDILVFSRTAADDPLELENHLAELDRVFKALAKAGLTVRLEKCQLAQTHVKYLGYELDGRGIRPSPSLTNSMIAMADPTTPKETRSIIGCFGFFRTHLPNSAEDFGLLTPLTTMDQRGFDAAWGPQHHDACDRLRRMLTQRPILAMPRKDAVYRVATDASDLGLGAMVTIDADANGPAGVVAFLSRVWTKAEKSYSVGEREALSLVYALKKCRQEWLVGQKVVVCSVDNQGIIQVFAKSEPIGRVARWVLGCSEFPLQLVYLPGPLTFVPDTLSRLLPKNTVWQNAVAAVTKIDKDGVASVRGKIGQALLQSFKVDLHDHPEFKVMAGSPRVVGCIRSAFCGDGAAAAVATARVLEHALDETQPVTSPMVYGESADKSPGGALACALLERWVR